MVKSHLTKGLFVLQNSAEFLDPLSSTINTSVQSAMLPHIFNV